MAYNRNLYSYYFVEEKERQRGAKILGMPLCLELDKYIDESVIDVEKQRMISMFFQQKPLDEVVFGSGEPDILFSEGDII